MTTVFKSVNFAYPSSDIAKMTNTNDSGCWYVSIRKDIDPGKPFNLVPYKTKQDAHKEAEKLPFDWCWYYLACNQEMFLKENEK